MRSNSSTSGAIYGSANQMITYCAVASLLTKPDGRRKCKLVCRPAFFTAYVHFCILNEIAGKRKIIKYSVG